MKSEEEQKYKHTLELLGTLRETPQREPTFEAHGKNRFLAEARYIKATVSPGPFQRLSKWISEMSVLPHFSLQKEHSRMFTAISSIILVFAVLLGGSGVTAYAAQDSLPNDLLYPVKLFIEDARYSLTSSPEAQVDLLVTFANNRVDEAVALTLKGDVVPEGMADGLQSQLYTMLQLAAGMDGEGTEGVLQHVRDQLRTRDQLMTMLGMPEDVDPALEQLMAMLENQHRLAEVGLEEPLHFQQMFYHNQEETPGAPSEAIDPQGNRNANCLEPGECEPLGGASNSNSGTASEASESGQGQPPEDTGNADPGNIDPGNVDPGNTDPGNVDPGNPAPGEGDPGDPDPGDPDPGDSDPGDPDPGAGSGGNQNGSTTEP